MNSGRENRSLVPRSAAGPVPGGDRLPARVQPDAAFSPDELGYDYDRAGRDDAWGHLSPRVQDLLRARVGGEIIDWWARHLEGGRVSATVLGPDGLCLAVPITKADGQRAVRLDVTRFIPGSLRVVEVDENVTRAAARRGEPAGVPKLSGVLPQEARGFLGNLPPRLQALIQEPFQAEPGLAYGYCYELTAELNTTTWWFGCYLSDGRSLTFASGRRTSKRGQPAGCGRWKAACHRASIVQ